MKQTAYNALAATKDRKESGKGFTLVELSVVLVVLAMVAGGALTLLTSSSERNINVKLQTNFAAIEEALLTYRKANDRLPCPANPALAENHANYGYETTPKGTCSGLTSGNTVYGVLPFKTLGLPDSAMLDGWGRRITYIVDRRITETSAFTTYNLFDPNIGSITVNDSSGGNRTTKAVVAIISHGTNGHGSFTRTGAVQRVSTGTTNADELQNCDCTSGGAADAGQDVSTIVQRSYTKTNAASDLSSFDDLVVYKMRFHFPSDESMLSEDEDESKNKPDIFVSTDSSLRAYKIESGMNILSAVEYPPISPALADTPMSIDISSNNEYLAAFTGAELRVFHVEDTLLSSMTVTPTVFSGSATEFSNGDATYLAVGGVSSALDIFKRNGNVFKNIVNNTTIWVSDLSFSPDNKYLAVARQNKATVMKRTGDSFYELPNDMTGGFQPAIVTDTNAAEFSPNGKFLAIGDASGVRMYRADPNDIFTHIWSSPTVGTVKDIDFSPDGSMMVAGLNAAPFIDYYSVSDTGTLTSLMDIVQRTSIMPSAPSAPTYPVISSFSVTGQEPIFNFLASDFTDSYNEAYGNSLSSIRIVSLPADGTLQLAGVPVTAGDTIASSDLSDLEFVPDALWTGSTSFSWEAYDGSEWTSSSSVNITITAVGVPSRSTSTPSAPTPNNPVVSNISVSGPGPDILFLYSDFSNAYADAEGNSISYIRILSTPSNGQLRVGSTPLNVNDTVAAADLNTLNFRPNSGWTGTTSFDWSATDTMGYGSSNIGSVSIRVTFQPPRGDVRELSFSKDGKYLAVANYLGGSGEFMTIYRVRADDLVKIPHSFTSSFPGEAIVMKK